MKKFIIFTFLALSIGGLFVFKKQNLENIFEKKAIKVVENVEILNKKEENDKIIFKKKEKIEDKEEKILKFSKEFSKFEEKKVNFKHIYNKKYLAFIGGAVLDIDSDGKDEFFISGGNGQKDGFFKFENGKFVNFIEKSGINSKEASYGVLSADFDGDSQTDLFVARESGVYFYKNNSGIFEEKKLNIDLGKKISVVDLTISDYDKDGDFDIYLSTFIKTKYFKSSTFNKESHKTQNFLLKNNGNFDFEKINLFNQNTFTSSFADLDGDGWDDLIISPNTDKIRIFKNEKGTFKEVFIGKNFGFWMGLSVSDFDNDGDLDLFFSNIGTSISTSIAKGDLKKGQNLTANYSFLENLGNFKFKEIIKEKKLTNLGFGWGILDFDLNLDNFSDFFVMQNYIKWPLHKFSKLAGSLIVNYGGEFEDKISSTNLENKNYGFSVLKGDFNGDLNEDLIYLNLNSEPRIFLNKGENKNNSFKVIFPDNLEYFGAKFELKVGDKKFKKTFVSKQGIMTDLGSSIIFSLGNFEKGELKVFSKSGEKNYKVLNGKILKL